MSTAFTISDVAKLAVAIVCFVAPLSVSSTFQSLLIAVPTSVVVVSLASALIGVYLVRRGRATLSTEQRTAVTLFYGPFVIAMMIGVPTALVLVPLRFDYAIYPLVAAGRIINMTLFFVILIGCLTLFQSRRTPAQRRRFVRYVARSYWLSTGLMALFGVWQMLDMYFGVLPFPFETRAYLHSIAAALNIVPGRLTGIVDEPSYYAPLLLDFIILTPLFLRGKWLFAAVGLGACLLALTFSGGGYLDAAATISALFVLQAVRMLVALKATVSMLAIIFFIGLTLVAVLLSPAAAYVPIVTSRLNGAFDVTQHIRTYMVLMPFSWAMDGNILNMLIGHGPKSYALLGNVYSLPGGGEPVDSTSNNIFTDNFWEHGLLGLIGILLLFGYLIKEAAAESRKSTEGLVTFLLSVHLFFSSCYRGDFASPRFIMLLLILLMLLGLRSSVNRNAQDPEYSSRARR